MHSAADLLVILENEAASLEERQAAGDALGRMGDERATRIDRVRIPAGTLRRLRGEAATENEGSALEVKVAGFSIDRFPVTVAAFSAFIEAGGYRQQKYWSKEGLLWREREKVSAPRFWGEAEWAAYLVPNHPVVGVSAYEAEAFAAHHGARLPTETEWERACRGDDTRCHPWGAESIADASAMRGYGPRGTLPIGVFPRAKSPFGVRDLVGCVWQWCARSSDEVLEGEIDHGVDREISDEPAKRVTRGGAWNTLQWSVTCTSRNAYPPTARFSNLGFRCAR